MLKKSLTEKSYHENFPVATLFLRKKERNDILVLYQFARECDDIADNENFKVDQRKKILNEYQKNIKQLFSKNNKPKLFINLQQVSIKYNLNINLFKNFTSTLSFSKKTISLTHTPSLLKKLTL